MKSLFQYAWLTVKHRWFVFLAGCKIGVPIQRLLLHDLSKFGPQELKHYGRQFFGDKGDPLGFSYAWLHHQRMNKHHWEAWIPVTGHNRGGYKDMEPLPMPRTYALEMLADWAGASKAYEGKWPESDWPWLFKNWNKIQLHPDTRKMLKGELKRVFHVVVDPTPAEIIDAFDPYACPRDNSGEDQRPDPRPECAQCNRYGFDCWPKGGVWVSAMTLGKNPAE